MLGERIEINLDRVVLLRDYPNSMYFKAFDATVQAGGYNSFHETRRFGLPALFYPNMNTGMDDQLARCRAAETEGWGYVVVERNKNSIRNGLERLLKIDQSNFLVSVDSGANQLYTTLTGHDVAKFSEGWMLPRAAIQWIEDNIESGARILEFGSGDASQSLALKYELYSVEHDVNWIGKTASNYIHAPIVKNNSSTKFDQEGWYDSSLFDEIPEIVELIIIDGPPGKIGRAGILEYLSHLPEWTYILIDDTDRAQEQELVHQFCVFFDCKALRIRTRQFKSNGDVRMFDILKRR